jgi:Aminotransferase class I and II
MLTYSLCICIVVCTTAGKVFTREELLAISDIVRDHPRLMVISDEVYKYMVYGCGDSDSNSDSTTTNTATNGDASTATTAAVQRGGALSPIQHVHFATLPGMWDRTVTISSAGKTFSVTGWQVGWVLGPRWLIQQVQTALPYMQFCAATPLQVRHQCAMLLVLALQYNTICCNQVEYFAIAEYPESWCHVMYSLNGSHSSCCMLTLHTEVYA